MDRVSDATATMEQERSTSPRSGSGNGQASPQCEDSHSVSRPSRSVTVCEFTEFQNGLGANVSGSQKRKPKVPRKAASQYNDHPLPRKCIACDAELADMRGQCKKEIEQRCPQCLCRLKLKEDVQTREQLQLLNGRQRKSVHLFETRSLNGRVRDGEGSGNGSASESDEHNRSFTPTPPPYSPLPPPASSDASNDSTNREETQQDQESPSVEAPQCNGNSRQPYMVLVEDISPVKSCGGGTSTHNNNDNGSKEQPESAAYPGDSEPQMSLLTLREHVDTGQPPPEEEGARLEASLGACEVPPRERQLHEALRRISTASQRSGSAQSQCDPNMSLMSVICERTESALITESGGAINNYNGKTQHCCDYCGRSYSRKDHYTKHTRRCQGRRRSRSRAASLASTYATSAGALSDRSGSETIYTPARVFHCPFCERTFPNVSELRAHKQTHMRHYSCPLCNNISTTCHEHELHYTICLAQREAREEIEAETEAEDEQQQNENDEAPLTPTPTLTRRRANPLAARRVTRALSRAISTYTGYSRCSTPAPSSRKSMAGMSSISRMRWKINGGYAHEDDERESEDDDDDDEECDLVSVADSTYSKRMRFIGEWLDDQAETSITTPETIECDLLFPQNPRVLIQKIEGDSFYANKQRDLYFLMQLKVQLSRRRIECLRKNCSYVTSELVNMMLHDFQFHFNGSWFYCRKCGNVFTRKVFLDYHLHDQNYGYYVCYKCTEVFNSQHQLDLHLLMHWHGDEYECTCCRLQFFDRDQFKEHCLTEKHKETRATKRTKFDLAAAITNAQPIPPKEPRIYKEFIREMHLPNIASHWAQFRPEGPHQPRVGVVDFPNPRNPNCAGWQSNSDHEHLDPLIAINM